MGRRRADPLVLTAEAVRLLATGEHGIKPRLLAAYVQKLQHVNAADIPAELAPLLAAIHKRLGHAADQTVHENTVAAKSALDRMSPAQAVGLARRIVAFNEVFAGSLYH